MGLRASMTSRRPASADVGKRGPALGGLGVILAAIAGVHPGHRRGASQPSAAVTWNHRCCDQLAGVWLGLTHQGVGRLAGIVVAAVAAWGGGRLRVGRVPFIGRTLRGIPADRRGHRAGGTSWQCRAGSRVRGCPLAPDSTTPSWWRVGPAGPDGAAPTSKHTCGFHPILVSCDITGELLAIKLAAGRCRREHRHRPSQRVGRGVRADPGRPPQASAGPGRLGRRHHVVIDWLTGRGTKRGRRVGVPDRLEHRRGGAGRDHPGAHVGVVAGDQRRPRRPRRRAGRRADRMARAGRLAAGDAGDGAPRTPAPRRATDPLRAARRLAPHRVGHRHPGWCAAVAIRSSGQDHPISRANDRAQ
jgi:hypothetical protein